MNKSKIGVSIQGDIESLKKVGEGARVKTVWDFECYDKNGKLKWNELQRPNIITTQGVNSLLNVYLDASTQITSWYISVIESDTEADSLMTYGTPTFTEWDGFDEAARQLYVPAAADGGIMTNSADKAIFTSAEIKTLCGAAMFGGGSAASTLSNTAGGGVLFCYSKFATSKEVEVDDVFKVTVTVTIATE